MTDGNDMVAAEGVPALADQHSDRAGADALGRNQPAFDDLPLLAHSGIRHSWGVFGADDQQGTVNRLTAEAVVAAASLVQTGERIPLSLPLTLPYPALFGRESLQHSIIDAGRNSLDDRWDQLYPQASTQWDGLRHIRAREDGFYGGWDGDGYQSTGRLGVQNWATGIIGRGILVDLDSHARLNNSHYDPFEHWAFSETDVIDALGGSSQLREGDVLCIRTGWSDKYLSLNEGERQELATRYESAPQRSWAGLSGSEAMSRFLWDSGASAVVADNPAIEAAPGDRNVGSLHRRLIPALGFAMGELFDLGQLAAACRRANRYEFLFISIPLNVPGGVGSPAAAVAVL